MALGLGAGALAYAGGAFIMGLALHPVGQHGWTRTEKVAVSADPLVWIGSVWGVVELWNRGGSTSRHAQNSKRAPRRKTRGGWAAVGSRKLGPQTGFSSTSWPRPGRLNTS